MILAEKGYLIFLTHEPDPDNAGVGMNITFMVHFVAPVYGAIFAFNRCDIAHDIWCDIFCNIYA
jgi:hypothetical protein